VAGGSIALSSGTLNLGKSFTLAGLGLYTRTGGTVNLRYDASLDL
jgi:hypothetical protein